MRVSDDRYSRERLRLDLALRFIQHEARTRTIRQWTGLTDDRIRKLYRTYVRSMPADPIRRHRGKSPQQTRFFTRSPAAQQDTAALASILSLFGVITAVASATAAPPIPMLGQPAAMTAGRMAAAALPPSVPRGERLCAAFEAYTRSTPNPLITFEHAVFLAMALGGGLDLRAQGCPHCGSLGVVDPIALRLQLCLDCGKVLSRGLRERVRPPPPLTAAALRALPRSR